MNLPHKLKNAFILCVIILTGLALRLYNVGFPSIGYHNMQENEYMAIAHNMEKTHDYIRKSPYTYDAFGDNPSAGIDAQPPLVSYQTLIAWKLFGENVWAPRIFNILFGLAGILVLYFISNLLFSSRNLSLFASLILAIIPLAVFFSRNLQPESPALFFMLLGNLFYLRFISGGNRYNLIAGGLSFSAAWLYKFSFLIGVLPFLFCFPLRARGGKEKSFASYIMPLLLPYLVILFSVFLLYRSGQFSFADFNAEKLSAIFSSSYWKERSNAIWWHMKGENFTLIFILLSLLGIVVAFLKRKGLAERYIMGWTSAIVPYCVFLSNPVSQNNYYQMPFLALVCVSTTYAVSFISGQIKRIVKRDPMIPIVMVIIILSVPSVRDSIMRMYSTVFVGVDVAGESLRSFTKPDERIFLLTHAQGYGIARYAQRYVGWTYELEGFKNKEKKFGVRYVCIYPTEFIRSLKQDKPELFDYIQSNYHIKEAGLTEEPERLFYLILEKGKSSEAQNFLESISGQKYLKTIYRIAGKYVFFYTVRP